MEFITGPNGIISIRFKNLSPVEAARLVGGIIGHVYDYCQQSKVTIDVLSTSLPIIPEQDKGRDQK